MARYSQAFAHIGRAKAAAYRQRRRQALAWLALYVILSARATER
jgi:hypothetical protein